MENLYVIIIAVKMLCKVKRFFLFRQKCNVKNMIRYANWCN